MGASKNPRFRCASRDFGISRNRLRQQRAAKGAYFTGKMLAQKLESLNANIRHQRARFARLFVKKTK